MAKISNRRDYLAIAAIVLAVAGLAVYHNPIPTGDSYQNFVMGRDEDDCSLDEKSVLTAEYRNSDGTIAQTDWICYAVLPFAPTSLPLAGVFGVAALLLLVLRSRPTSKGRR
jgi:hypothetical protein